MLNLLLHPEISDNLSAATLFWTWDPFVILTPV